MTRPLDRAAHADDSQSLRAESGIRTLVVATDFSTSATIAVRRAAQLGRVYNARIHLIYVMSPARRRAGAVLNALGAGAPFIPTAALSRLHSTAAHITAEFGVSVDTYLGIGNVSREINALAHRTHADLVVLGNSRSNFFAEVFGTSMGLRIQRRTGLPLLAVLNEVSGPYRRALLASDLSPEAARAGQQALRLLSGAELNVLHAFESQYADTLSIANVTEDVVEDYRRRAQVEGMERLSAFAHAARLDQKAILHVTLGHPALATKKQARELGVDLIVLLPSRRWPGVADHLIAGPPCDLLLMP